MKFSKFALFLIVLVPIGLVLAPVLRTGIRSEIAHWYLAAAANAIELGKGDADKSLESARAWDPEVGKLQDYWSVRLRQLKASPGETLMDVLKEVPEERKREIGERLARQFGSKGEFALAAGVLKVLLGEQANQNILYWNVMISQALEEDSASKAIQLLREAIAANPDNSELRVILARQFAFTLSELDEFDSALEAYKLWFGEKYDRDTITLNALAYSRALAHVELDQALIDINEALGYRPDDPDLRDTRGWVLYHLGRYEEGLIDADFAVKAKESPSMANWLQSLFGSRQTASLLDNTQRAEDSTSPNEIVPPQQVEVPDTSSAEPPVAMPEPPKTYLTSSSANIMIWTRGVLRYHRAKILEKVGRTEEAKADWKWLEENHLPPDDRLH